jgi:transcriptional regulator GlxA family with amidase domain
MRRDAPGQDAVLDRLVDLVLITTLRAWFARDRNTAPGWWLASEDPLVGDVLRLMHDRPAEPWTLESLAAQCAVSRATLARRFTQLLGQPPMTYLTEWRLCLAADLLQDTSQTIDAIARQTGYASPFAFSTAFRRRFGQPPRSFRRAAGAAGAYPG